MTGRDAADAADPVAPPPPVAAFDFDGTLTDGGSVWAFLSAVAGRRRVVAAAARHLPSLVAAALFGGRHADDAKERLFEAALGGRPAAVVEAEAERFGRDHFRRHARADVRERLEAHRRLGHRLVIVSASPELYLRPVAAELGVDGLIATALEVDGDGRLTGRYAGANCRGAEKARRVAEWIGASTDPPVLWVYGNSAGDRDLLARATVGVDVGRLGRFGRLRHFTRLVDAPPAG